MPSSDTGTVYIVGAGLAGLAAAVRLTAQGRRVAVHEATGQPGGRCRSYYDHVTGMVIDNGSHLLLSGNYAAREYLEAIGAEHLLEGPPSAEFGFIDLPTLKRWTVRFNDGQIPWWIFDKNRRVPDTKARDYLGLMRLMFTSGDRPLSELVRCEGPLYDRLLEPLFLAALNIEPLVGSGKLAGQIIRETLALGGQACRPLIAPGGIGDAFIAPALRTLREQGVEVTLQHPLHALEYENDRVRALDFGDEAITLGEGDQVILAVPAFIATAMVPGLSAPTAFRSIVNAHFRVDPPEGAPRMIGVVNGTTEWIFALPGRVAVTVSDAGELVDASRADVAQTIWNEVAKVLGLSDTLPPWQIVRERRATFAATPEENAKRPAPVTRWRNLVLAGDWTATGLPATIEGAVRSGHRAAELVAGQGAFKAGRMMPEPARTSPDPEALDRAIDGACDALYRTQQADGHWVYELEADATIPAEYVLLRHYRGEPVNAELERKIGVYLRRIQSAKHDGWPLFQDGEFDMSATVKAYFALKTIGDDIGAPHMKRARDAILSRGGAVNVNVFTRILLALFGIMDWKAVPMMPVEIALLPQWFPFHLTKISYWGRTVLAPLLVLFALRPRAVNAKGIKLDELFLQPLLSIGPAEKAPHQNSGVFAFFRGVDVILRKTFTDPPAKLRERAITKVVKFVSERLNGKDGLGAIFPAMANACMMFDALGDKAKAEIARDSVERLLVVKDGEAYCQPCVSPVWDSVLAAQALLDVGSPNAVAHARKALDWLKPLQVLDVEGDWIVRAPGLRPGGWAFQYANPHYPDLDDTAVVIMAMDRAQKIDGDKHYEAEIARAEEWVRGMQSRNGGWAAFDIDNTHEYLNNIPFADHGALVDPPTEDVGARCVSALAQLGAKPDDPNLERGIDYLLGEQLDDGSWYGRWGLNYIYGTWSVLCALNAAGLPHDHPALRKAANWLVSIQNADGGWGEDGDSYKLAYKGHEKAPSTASQTAWALMGLMAAGEVSHPAVARGVDYLMRTQGGDGFWEEERFTGTGFPRVFYLRYHGYRKYFPLWALARYRRLRASNERFVFGM